jgi:hypothetical protein
MEELKDNLSGIQGYKFEMCEAAADAPSCDLSKGSSF